MATAKKEIQELLEELPEDSTYEEIQYHIYVRQKIQQGLADVEEDRVVSQEEVERQMEERWLDK
jgi:predicted transcriptional regulator